jgi:hypothetical protein
LAASLPAKTSAGHGTAVETGSRFVLTPGHHKQVAAVYGPDQVQAVGSMAVPGSCLRQRESPCLDRW